MVPPGSSIITRLLSYRSSLPHVHHTTTLAHIPLAAALRLSRETFAALGSVSEIPPSIPLSSCRTRSLRGTHFHLDDDFSAFFPVRHTYPNSNNTLLLWSYDSVTYSPRKLLAALSTGLSGSTDGRSNHRHPPDYTTCTASSTLRPHSVWPSILPRDSRRSCTRS